MCAPPKTFGSLMKIYFILLHLEQGLSMQFRREELEEATAQFSFGCLIGTGAYGTVYLGKNLHNSGTSVAVKVLNKVYNYHVW